MANKEERNTTERLVLSLLQAGINENMETKMEVSSF